MYRKAYARRRSGLPFTRTIAIYSENVFPSVVFRPGQPVRGLTWTRRIFFPVGSRRGGGGEAMNDQGGERGEGADDDNILRRRKLPGVGP